MTIYSTFFFRQLAELLHANASPHMKGAVPFFCKCLYFSSVSVLSLLVSLFIRFVAGMIIWFVMVGASVASTSKYYQNQENISVYRVRVFLWLSMQNTNC
jgi:hypothetical protein